MELIDLQNTVKELSESLCVDIPEIILHDGSIMRDINDPNTALYSVMFRPGEKGLHEEFLTHYQMIISSDKTLSNQFMLGIIAHEVRHIWQYTHCPQKYETHAYYAEDSLFHPAEIDADGFAIFIVATTFRIPLFKAADIVSGDVKIINKKAYQNRLGIAMHFCIKNLWKGYLYSDSFKSYWRNKK